MKILIYLLLLSSLFGCTLGQFSQQKQPAGEEKQRLFLVAFDRYVTTGQLDSMALLQRQFPDSIWGEYAQTVLQNARLLEEKTAELNDIQENTQRVQVDNQQRVEQQTAELDSLKAKNTHLTEKIEQLKKILIEQEQRLQ